MADASAPAAVSYCWRLPVLKQLQHSTVTPPHLKAKKDPANKSLQSLKIYLNPPDLPVSLKSMLIERLQPHTSQRNCQVLYPGKIAQGQQ
jgi:hypothetical protein